MFDRRRVGHEPLAVIAQGDHRQLEVDPAGKAGRQLVNLGHLNVADGEERDVLVREGQEILDPFHRLRMEEQISPFHVLIAAQTPELHRIGRLPADVVENELPVLVGRLGRIERFAVGMVDLVAELALHRTGLAEADGNFPALHLADEHLAVVLVLEDGNWVEDG